MGYSEEHEAYLREHEDIQPDEDYEMDLKTSDRKKLWALSGNECSICKCKLVRKEDSNTNVGEECHISSEKPDWPSKEFSRYEPGLEEDKRNKSIDNAILLCSNCHKIIDNPESTQFTIERLHQIKEEHEADIAKKYTEDSEEDNQKVKRINFHTSKLIEIIREWQRVLPAIHPTEETKTTNRFSEFDTSFIKKIENHYYFKDFFHHYPDFKKDWEDFKLLSDKYDSERQKLITLIKEKINEKLGQKFNIEFDVNIEDDVEDGLKEGFRVSVYRAVIIKAKGKDSRYVYDITKMSSNGIEKNQIFGCQDAGKGRPLTGTCHLLVTTSELNKIEEIEAIHKEAIEDCIKQYIDKSKEIVELEKKLRTDRDKLKLSLENICEKPFFILNMDCEFVKITTEVI